jgi:hypothetical protein
MADLTRLGQVLTVSTLVTANGNLFPNTSTNNIAGLIDARGYAGFMYICIQKTGAGTITMTPQGSFDGGTTFYAVGFTPVDAQATLTRTVTALSITGGAFNHVYQINDAYPFYQFALSAISGANSVGAYLYYSPL